MTRALRHKASQRGFTLIELLVVVAIIALLAAILFPVFARARENARRSSCQSNMKQIGLGILQYIQDYDDQYPTSGTATFNIGGNSSVPWSTTTQPYLKSTQILRCPSLSSSMVKNPIFATDPASIQVTYQMNAFLGAVANSNGLAVNKYSTASGCGGQTCTPQAASLNMLTTPATTIMLLEDVNLNGSGRWSSYMDGGSSPCGFSATSAEFLAFSQVIYPSLIFNFVNIHLEGQNIAFCDGHVKWEPASKLKSLGNGGKAFGGYTGCTTNTSAPNNGDVDITL